MQRYGGGVTDRTFGRSKGFRDGSVTILKGKKAALRR